MGEFGEALQMIQLSMQGMTLAGRATLETLRIMKRMAIFLALMTKNVVKTPHRIKYWKTRGKTNIDNLKQKGGTLEVLSLSKKEYESFQAKARKWGILYSENPTFKEDDKVYISFASEQAPSMEKALEAVKKENLKEYKQQAEKEAIKLKLKGKERKEFIESYINVSLQKFENQNKRCSVEQYFQESGLATCADDDFDRIMKEKFGSAYEEMQGLEENLKKKKFEDVVTELSTYKKNAPSAFICKPGYPDTYIKVNWDIRENNGQEFLNTEFEVFREGEKQTCDEFKHGSFCHYTRKNGEASSEYGTEHWQNLVNEMKSKGGFDDEVLYFANKKEYEDYVKQVAEQQVYKNVIEENTVLEELENRRKRGDIGLKADRSQIVDVDMEQKKCKVDTGIVDDFGRHYYLWTSLDNVFYEENKFHVLLPKEESVTISSYFGSEKIELMPEELGEPELYTAKMQEAVKKQTENLNVGEERKVGRRNAFTDNMIKHDYDIDAIEKGLLNKNKPAAAKGR